MLALVAAACGGDGGKPSALADRVLALLEADPGVVDGDLDEAEVTCPSPTEPAEGDRATCVLGFADGREVEVDVEFRPGGAISVVAVVPR